MTLIGFEGSSLGITWVFKESRWLVLSKYRCLFQFCGWFYKVQQLGYYIERLFVYLDRCVFIWWVGRYSFFVILAMFSGGRVGVLQGRVQFWDQFRGDVCFFVGLGFGGFSRFFRFRCRQLYFIIVLSFRFFEIWVLMFGFCRVLGFREVFEGLVWYGRGRQGR